MRLRTTLSAAGLALLLASSIANAGPKEEAGELFAQGLRLYAEKNYTEASVALAASYQAHPEQRTLFAWAQAERLSGHCDKSRDLLAKYVASGANSKQSRAAFKLMEDCLPGTDAGSPGEGNTVDSAGLPGNPGPSETGSAPAVSASAPPEGAPAPASATASMGAAPSAKPWHKDWVAIGLLSTGAIGLTLGGLQYASALSVESAANSSGTSYEEFLDLRRESENRRTFAAIAGTGGVLLLGAGITYLVLRDAPQSQERSLSLRIDGSSAGFSIGGDF